MKSFFSYNRGATDSISNIVVICLVILTLALPIFGPGLAQTDWGFNQIGYLPSVLYYLWILLAAVMAALMLLTPRSRFLPDATATYLWGDRKVTGRIVLMAAALVLFFAFRFDAHLYGNGYIRTANFAQRSEPIFDWIEYGGTIVPYALYQIIHALGAAKLTAAVRAYQIISFASGIWYLLVCLKISEHVSNDGNDRVGFFALTIFTGLSMFFFGMIENTPLLLPVTATFVYFILKHIQFRRPDYIIYIWLITLVGILLDIRMLPLVPASLYVTLSYLIKRRRMGRFLASLTASVAILCAIAIVYLDAVGNIALSRFILFLSGKPPDTNYSLLSIRHLADIFGLFYMFIPLLGIYLYGIIRGFVHLKSDRLFVALLFLTISQILCIFILDPGHGMARDIHIFGFLLTGFLFLGIYSLVRSREKLKLSGDVFMTLLPISLVLILPVFFVHLSAGATERYLEDYLSYNETKYEPALLALRDFYIVEGHNEKAVEVERSITSRSPAALQSQLVNDLYAHERVSEAFEYAIQLVERHPYNATYRMQKGNILKHYRRFADAEEELRTALELDPYYLEVYHFLSELYRETGRDEECRKTLERAIAVDPMSMLILVDLTGYYYRNGQTQTADSLTEVMRGLNPEEPYVYMYKGLICERRGRKEAALEHYEKFVDLKETLPEVPQIRKRMNRIVLEMRDTTSRE